MAAGQPGLEVLNMVGPIAEGKGLDGLVVELAID